jgi:hypothetical protein
VPTTLLNRTVTNYSCPNKTGPEKTFRTDHKFGAVCKRSRGRRVPANLRRGAGLKFSDLEDIMTELNTNTDDLITFSQAEQITILNSRLSSLESLIQLFEG